MTEASQQNKISYFSRCRCFVTVSKWKLVGITFGCDKNINIINIYINITHIVYSRKKYSLHTLEITWADLPEVKEDFFVMIFSLNKSKTIFQRGNETLQHRAGACVGAIAAVGCHVLDYYFHSNQLFSSLHLKDKTTILI